MGILDMATIGHVEDSEGGRSAFLAPPYDVVGPFSLDELETRGRIAFGECLVMSRQRWQEDQVDLRVEARKSAGPSCLSRFRRRCWVCIGPRPQAWCRTRLGSN